MLGEPLERSRLNTLLLITGLLLTQVSYGQPPRSECVRLLNSQHQTQRESQPLSASGKSYVRLLSLYLKKEPMRAGLVLKELFEADSESSVPYNPIKITSSIFEEQLKEKFKTLVPKISTQEWSTLLQEVKVLSGENESQSAQRQRDQDETQELGSLELETTNIVPPKYLNISHIVASMSDGSKLILLGDELYTWDRQNGYAVIEDPDFQAEFARWTKKGLPTGLDVFPTANGVDYFFVRSQYGPIVMFRYQDRRFSYVRAWSTGHLDRLTGWHHSSWVGNWMSTDQVVKLNGVDHFMVQIHEHVYLLPLNAESLDFWYWKVPLRGQAVQLELIDVDSERALFQAVKAGRREIFRATTRTPVKMSLADLDQPTKRVAHKSEGLVNKLKNIIKTSLRFGSANRAANARNIHDPKESPPPVSIQIRRNVEGDTGLNGLRHNQDIYYTSMITTPAEKSEKKSIGVFKLEDVHLIQSAVAGMGLVRKVNTVGELFSTSAADKVRSAKINDKEYSLFFKSQYNINHLNYAGYFKLVEVSKEKGPVMVLYYDRPGHRDDIVFNDGYVLSVSGGKVFLVLQTWKAIWLASVYDGQLELLKELVLPESENVGVMYDPIVFEDSRNRGSSTFYQILPPARDKQTNSPLMQLKIRVPKSK